MISQLQTSLGRVARSSATCFWECHDGFCPLQAALEPTRRRFEGRLLPLELLDARIRRHLPPAPLGREPCHAWLPPRHHMRGIEAVLPQQRAQLARLPAGVRLPQHLELVRRRESSSGAARRDLGVRGYRRGERGIAHDRGRPSTAGRLASLVAPPFRLSHDRLAYQQAANYFHRPVTSSPYTLIVGELGVSLILSERGSRSNCYPCPRTDLLPMSPAAQRAPSLT